MLLLPAAQGLQPAPAPLRSSRHEALQGIEVNSDDPQFWLNAHYIEKWDGVEARNEFLSEHGIIVAGHAGNAEYKPPKK
jgi:hypothetical protein